nr:DUF1361 domain-containing protein [Enterococcus sp. 4G2_DIV0659]
MLFFADTYHFMALNVFLAYIPLEISFHLNRLRKRGFVLASVLWLLFYPNAPYLFTDFFHLENLSIYHGMNQLFGQSLSDWGAFALLAIGICVYGFLGMSTIYTVLFEAEGRRLFTKKWQGFMLFLMINVLSSLAIFVGRFDRLHSVHLFTQPIKTVQTIFFSWSMDKGIYIAIFTGLQIVLLFAVNFMMKMGPVGSDEKSY